MGVVCKARERFEAVGDVAIEDEESASKEESDQILVEIVGAAVQQAAAALVVLDSMPPQYKALKIGTYHEDGSVTLAGDGDETVGSA